MNQNKQLSGLDKTILGTSVLLFADSVVAPAFTGKPLHTYLGLTSANELSFLIESDNFNFALNFTGQVLEKVLAALGGFYVFTKTYRR